MANDIEVESNQELLGSKIQDFHDALLSLIEEPEEDPLLIYRNEQKNLYWCIYRSLAASPFPYPYKQRKKHEEIKGKCGQATGDSREDIDKRLLEDIDELLQLLTYHDHITSNERGRIVIHNTVSYDIRLIITDLWPSLQKKERRSYPEVSEEIPDPKVVRKVRRKLESLLPEDLESEEESVVQSYAEIYDKAIKIFRDSGIPLNIEQQTSSV